MYIFELIFQLFRGKKYKKAYSNPVEVDENALIENPNNCEHLFLPLDSTNTMFACKYCGLVVHKDQLKF